MHRHHDDGPELIEEVPADQLYAVLREQAEDPPDGATGEDDLLTDAEIEERVAAWNANGRRGCPVHGEAGPFCLNQPPF